MLSQVATQMDDCSRIYCLGIQPNLQANSGWSYVGMWNKH